MKQWWIGCSGFTYKHWKEKFYPADVAQKRWFEYYCEHFNTVEINVTFYRLPKIETFKTWYHQSPHEFRFTVKAPRGVTHYKKFLNAKESLTRFYDTVNDGLHDKLGTILFQLPPNFVCNEGNLERLITSMDSHFANVIEFRHESWWNEEVIKTLNREQICFCSISYPDLPDTVIPTKRVMYYRFHGVPDLYRSSYTKATLKSVADQIKSLQGIQDVYIYFNNDIDVAAISNAKQVQRITDRFLPTSKSTMNNKTKNDKAKLA